MFGEYLTSREAQIKVFVFSFSLLEVVFFFCLLRFERALLPVPGFHHLPQLAAGEAAHVLVGPKLALRQARGGYNGQ